MQRSKSNSVFEENSRQSTIPGTRKLMSIFKKSPSFAAEPTVVPTGSSQVAMEGRRGRMTLSAPQSSSARQSGVIVSRMSSVPSSRMSSVPSSRNSSIAATKPTSSIRSDANNPYVQPGSWITIRHIIKLVRRLLSESQTILAVHLLDRLLREASFEPALDSLLAGSNDVVSQFLSGFVSSERRDTDKVFESLESSVSQLLGNEQWSLEGSSTSKLSPRSTAFGDRALTGSSSKKTLARPSLVASLGLEENQVRATTRNEGHLDFLSQAALDEVSEEPTSLNELLDPLDTDSRRESFISTTESINVPVADEKKAAAITSHLPTTSLAGMLGLPTDKTKESKQSTPSMSREPSLKSLTRDNKMQGAEELPSMPAKHPHESVNSDTESDASMMEDDEASTPPPNKLWSVLAREVEVMGAMNHLYRTSKENTVKKQESAPKIKDGAGKRSSRETLIAACRRASGLQVDDTEQAPEPSQDYPTTCRCGNVFMSDAVFCRKCGSRRVEPESSPHSGECSQRSSRQPSKAVYDDGRGISDRNGSLTGRENKRRVSWPSENAPTAKPRDVFLQAHDHSDSSVQDPSLQKSTSAPCTATSDLNAWAEAVPRIQLTDLSNGSPKATRFVLPEGHQKDSAQKEQSEKEQNGFEPASSFNESNTWQPGSSARGPSAGAFLVKDKPVQAAADMNRRKFALKSEKSKRDRRAAVTGMLHGMILKDNLEEDQAQFLSTSTHPFIINPSSGCRMSWDTVSLTIILMESVILPLGLAFNMYPPDAVMWISTIFFTPDIVLNFVTGFYHNGMLVMRQNIIVKRYVFGWFSIDFFSTVPWEVFLSSNQGQASFFLKFAKIGKLMRVLRLLRILKLKALLQRFEDMFTSYIVLFTISVAKTVMCYVLFCHWTGCIWGWLGNYPGDAQPHDKEDCEPDGPCEKGIGIDDSPWRHRYGLDASPPAAQYLTSLQFATGLLTGSDLQLMPGYWAERLFVTIMMIVSFLVCSMIISQIVVVMEKINQDNSEYLEDTRMIRDFMVSRGMPLKLQTKVKRYLEYQFKSRKVVHQNHEILKKLSPFLRIEIQDHMNKSILEHHPFFAGMEASVFSEVCYLARSVLYAPGDVVMRKGQLTSLICFIVRGQLMVKDVREGFSVYIKAPAWTGDRGLWVTSERTHTVVCAMHTELLIIQQQDLIALVKNFPAAEAYIKEYCRRVLLDDPSVCFCSFCRCAGHELANCDELDDAILNKGVEKKKGRDTVRHTLHGLKAGLPWGKNNFSFGKMLDKVNPYSGLTVKEGAINEDGVSRSTVRHDAYVC